VTDEKAIEVAALSPIVELPGDLGLTDDPRRTTT